MPDITVSFTCDTETAVLLTAVYEALVADLGGQSMDNFLALENNFDYLIDRLCEDPAYYMAKTQLLMVGKISAQVRLLIGDEAADKIATDWWARRTRAMEGDDYGTG